MDEVGVTEEFVEENQKQKISYQKKSGGPYSKKQRQQRQSEVFRLHFELGYSARKISDMMKVNRHTIDVDIKQIYSQIGNEWNSYSVDSWFMKQALRMESQRARLIEKLDDASGFQERMAVERMILEIDTRLANMAHKIMTSRELVVDEIKESLNEYAEKNKMNMGYVRYSDLLKLSKKSTEQVLKIVKEDKERNVVRI